MQDARRHAEQLLGRIQAVCADAADAAGRGTARRVLNALSTIVLVALLMLTGAFRSLGLSLGVWSLPAFMPTWAWAFGYWRGWWARPRWLADLRGRQRLGAAATVFLLLRLAWPLWATPAAFAWQQAEGGLGETFEFNPRFPFGTTVTAAPMALGLVAFVLMLFAMTLLPRGRRHTQPLGPPPLQPESLRSALLVSDRADRRRP